MNIYQLIETGLSFLFLAAFAGGVYAFIRWWQRR